MGAASFSSTAGFSSTATFSSTTGFSSTAGATGFSSTAGATGFSSTATFSSTTASSSSSSIERESSLSLSSLSYKYSLSIDFTGRRPRIPCNTDSCRSEDTWRKFFCFSILFVSANKKAFVHKLLAESERTRCKKWSILGIVICSFFCFVVRRMADKTLVCAIKTAVKSSSR